MLKNVFKTDDISIYQIEDNPNKLLNRYIISTPGTREICNDPQICGIEYTNKVRKACTKVLEAFPLFSTIHLDESKTMVLNVLRGGLNFGLREALADSYNWNTHSTSFISAQRARKNQNSEEWHIIESDYKKLYLPDKCNIVFGDVVATGTSLLHALRLIVREAKDNGKEIENMVFFTFGGGRSEDILNEITAICHKEFGSFKGADLFYIEGRFVVPDKDTPVSIKLTGTDLIRRDALMAPEFIHSQYELPFYPLERCVIYDAGSRAFWIREYVADVIEYWEETKALAAEGISFADLLAERFPEIDATKFGKQNLMSLCEQHIGKLHRIIPTPKSEAVSE